jgi:preprotein translocase subunit YajC
MNALTLIPFQPLLAADPAQPGGGLLDFMPALIAIGFLFYFMMIRPERRRAASHKALLEGLKKNDRVLTIGGIYGTVTNVQRETDEVTIRVDETNNVKLRVQFGSIARILGDEASSDKTVADSMAK